MADGRAGRRPVHAPDGSRAVLTLRMDGKVKNLAASMASGYGMTVAEYVESLVMRDAGETGHRP